MIAEYANPLLITCVLALLGGFFGSIGAYLGWYLASKVISG